MPVTKKKSYNQRKKQIQHSVRKIRESQDHQTVEESDKVEKTRERKRESFSKRYARSEFRAKHLRLKKEQQSRKLANEKERARHNKANALSQRKRLHDNDKRDAHNKRQQACQSKRLEDKEKRDDHNKRQSECQSKRLENPEKRDDHIAKNAAGQAKRLEDKENRDEHNKRQSECQSKRLENPEKRDDHNKRQSECQSKRLEDTAERELHRARLSNCQKSRLSHPEKREVHLDRLKKCQQKRLGPVLDSHAIISLFSTSSSDNENELNEPTIDEEILDDNINADEQNEMSIDDERIDMAMNRHIHNISSLSNYHLSRQRSRDNKRDNLFNQYRADIKDGPSHECVSCCRLFFLNSLTYCTVEMIINNNTKITMNFIRECCPLMINDTDIGYLCSACKSSLKKNEKPRFSLCHKELKFPDVAEELIALTPLGERFVAPRTEFITLMEVQGQMKSTGRIVNVPTDPQSNVDILPHMPHETQVVAVAFKKKRNYKSNVLFETLNPETVRKALLALSGSKVYQRAGVVVDFNRMRDIEAFVQDNLNPEESEMDVDDPACDSDDSDDEEPINIPAEHTLLMQSEALLFAPGENFNPISLFYDTDAESMSFIKIYGGELKEYPAHLSYQEISKSEVMRSDRRVAQSIEKLFFSALYIRLQKISSSIAFCMRKSKGPSGATVGEVLSNSFISSLVLQDSGFKQFAVDRGSPAFFEMKKKELFAMIRQLGPPTFFLTLSPAETKWPELIVILKKLVDGETITEEAAMNIEYQDLRRLIKMEPVTCARYFEYRTRKLFGVLKQKDSVFREFTVKDVYERVEFQKRGSPHIHSLIWLEGAPEYIEGSEESKEICIEFTDRFITCDSNHPDLNEPSLIEMQRHRHTFTCYKNRAEKVCRFGFPLFPMRDTLILDPLQDSVNAHQLKKMKDKNVEIKAYLTDLLKKDLVSSTSIDDILNYHSLTYDEYILVIRSSIKKATVFLKRSPSDIMINAYNPEILSLHRANMDCQLILDMYSVAVYCSNYINKSNAGMSRLLRTAIEETRQGNLSTKEKLRFMANKFLNASEFCAQEAVYYILSMPLSKSSRSTIFINTGPPESRVQILKTSRELEKLPQSSTNIYKDNVLDHYINRPDKLENVCLADFAAYYTYSSGNISASRALLQNYNSDTEQAGEEENSDIDDPDFNPRSKSKDKSINEYQLKNSSGKVVKRQRAKVIRYRRYNIEQDEIDYYREQLMLFLPWRNEKDDLLEINHQTKFQENKDEVLKNRKKYIYGDDGSDFNQDIIDKAFEEIERDNQLDKENEVEENIDDLDREERTNEGDVFNDLGIQINNTTDNITFPIPQMLDDENYYKLLRSMNLKQQKYLLHILHAFKTNKLPLYECILGGAGVGKTRLIQGIQQTLLRYFNSVEETNLETLKVLLVAYTGKASFNIGGMTLHAAFVLPTNQNRSEMPALSSNVANTLYSKLRDLELIIIDEISMVGARIFNQINRRLQQIFRTSEVFAGKSILLLGDFNQLSPVGDSYIFKPDSSNPYSLLAGAPLWDKFTFYKLTEIMRQKDDATFANALNNLAEGNLTEDDIRMFQGRNIGGEPEGSIRLFRTNAEVNGFNDEVFESKRREKVDVIEHRAIDKVVGDKIPISLHTSLLKSVNELETSKTYGLPKNLNLCEGVHYMVTVNIKVTDGLVNGAIGVLKFIEKRNETVVRLWLLFDNISVGKQARQDYRNIAIKNQIDLSYTPIDITSRNIKPRKNSNALVMRRQFPLVPAEAMTICKSQGGTYSSAVVHLRPGLRRNEIYVAFSRVTSLSGLYIRGQFKPPTSVQSEVKQVIQDVLTNRPVNLHLTYLQDYPDKFSILFQNVQSLRAHIEDIKADKCIMSASIIALVETWKLSSDQFDLNGYKVVYQADITRSNRPFAYGLIVYCKDNIPIDVIKIADYNNEDTNLRCNLVLLQINNVHYIFGYKPPSTKFSVIEPLMKSMLDSIMNSNDFLPIIVVGDFNVNIMNKNSSPLHKVLVPYNLRSMIENKPTTNLSTQIDVIFSNISNINASTYESYYSYHKPIVCLLPQEYEIRRNDEVGNSYRPQPMILCDDELGNELLNHGLFNNDFRTPPPSPRNRLFNELRTPPRTPGKHKKQCVNVSRVTDDEYSIIEIRTPPASPAISNDTRITPVDLRIMESNLESTLISPKRVFNSSKNSEKTQVVLKGFKNDPKNGMMVSCYANSSCQGLLNTPAILASILSVQEETPLKSIAVAYVSNDNGELSTDNLRGHVDEVIGQGPQFTLQEYQDAEEFLRKIFEITPLLNQILSHYITRTCRCTNCHCQWQDPDEVSNVLPLRLKRESRRASLQELLNSNYGQWELQEDRQCRQCNARNCVTTKNNIQINDTCTALVIQLIIYRDNGTKIHLIMENLHENITINNATFQPTSIIVHHGELLSAGHYTCIVRTESSWIVTDDTRITNCAIPRAVEDAYVVMLNKI